MPRTHGSALFTRGETQALVTITLGTPDDSQIMDTLDGESSKAFMVHYNFPPFSVGEVSFLRGPGRREIGHGALAERAIRSIIPAEEQFPYTIRVVSDILESNGSSSMATVCGGSLALMDAGVPIPKHVAGVAMGLIKEGERYAILTDIAGFEDHYGDMDFKVAGTADGVTALQMDIKITGITPEIMKEALDQAHRGRMFLLDKMNQIIAQPRANLSENAPRLYKMEIAVHRIKDLIGPGGKNIKAIVDATKAKIDIENDGTVKIYALDEASAQDAIRRINELCEEAEIGQDLQRPRDPARGLRRVRRDHPRHRGAAAHLRGVPPPHRRHPRRAEARRRDPGQGAGHRAAQQDPPQHESAAGSAPGRRRARPRARFPRRRRAARRPPAPRRDHRGGDRDHRGPRR